LGKFNDLLFKIASSFLKDLKSLTLFFLKLIGTLIILIGLYYIFDNYRSPKAKNAIVIQNAKQALEDIENLEILLEKIRSDADYLPLETDIYDDINESLQRISEIKNKLDSTIKSNNIYYRQGSTVSSHESQIGNTLSRKCGGINCFNLPAPPTSLVIDLNRDNFEKILLKQKNIDTLRWGNIAEHFSGLLSEAGYSKDRFAFFGIKDLNLPDTITSGFAIVTDIENIAKDGTFKKETRFSREVRSSIKEVGNFPIWFTNLFLPRKFETSYFRFVVFLFNEDSFADDPKNKDSLRKKNIQENYSEVVQRGLSRSMRNKTEELGKFEIRVYLFEQLEQNSWWTQKVQSFSERDAIIHLEKAGLWQDLKGFYENTVN